MKFTKMHGAGNDYVYIDCTKIMVANPKALSKKISDRHFGVGSDGLVLICPSNVADFKMRMFNPDGSEAQMCGNASRCVAKYLYDNKMIQKTEMTLETLAGIKRLTLFPNGRKVHRVMVDMGVPELHPAKIPMAEALVAMGEEDVINFPLEVDKKIYMVTCLSMGNPHAVNFVKSTKIINVQRVGKLVEHHRLFPEITNAEFVELLSRSELRMRVWERGTGETLACGTGACAALVAAVLNDYADRKATIHLPGGDLDVEWDEDSNHVFMTGEAETVFEGEFYT
ncbi:MAG: diaminopimelate epimerase [Prevotellaceae bacterium]|jgi:diaminopimelate epimerase|nr:diaminopimelate epimerase [Prevotellaceae bacterium]